MSGGDQGVVARRIGNRLFGKQATLAVDDTLQHGQQRLLSLDLARQQVATLLGQLAQSSIRA